MTGPRVSVVIPAYNNAKVIGETIDSVLAQEGVDLELVIADHSSTDGTRAVIEQYESDPRVTLLDTPSGGGAPATGIASLPRPPVSS
ncbi:Hyaluronan synthase [Microbacterium oxydans]|uniref:Hyaluronan synthase n=1 Tax=Microbacterium oxydans TaxID=82380 RepID=A0A3S9WLQ6_9MICO|nr:glycosyltransferase [Microbacterium oxydans]AZS41052.1 Hyaluronan synthase [Microbacterium oxydans]